MDGCLWTKRAKRTLDEWMLGGRTLDATATMLLSVRELCSDGERRRVGHDIVECQ
jgi:Na+/proline symporter